LVWSSSLLCLLCCSEAWFVCVRCDAALFTSCSVSSLTGRRRCSSTSRFSTYTAGLCARAALQQRRPTPHLQRVLRQ
jgi:hypothetical protein